MVLWLATDVDDVVQRGSQACVSATAGPGPPPELIAPWRTTVPNFQTRWLDSSRCAGSTFDARCDTSTSSVTPKGTDRWAWLSSNDSGGARLARGCGQADQWVRRSSAVAFSRCVSPSRACPPPKASTWRPWTLRMSIRGPMPLGPGTERLEGSGRSIPAQGATRICPSLADKPVMARAVLGPRNEPEVIDQDWHDDLPEP